MAQKQQQKFTSPSSSRNVSSRDLRSRNRLDQFVKKRQLNGGKFTPPTNPPDVTFQPWNSLTLMTIRNGKTTDYKPYDIAALIKDQLDPQKHGFRDLTTKGSDGLRFQFRLKSVAVWNLTGRVVALSVSDFMASESSSGMEQLAGLVDAGTSTHTPAVGYSYPQGHRRTVLRNATDEAFLFNVTAGDNDTICLQVHMEWRFDGPVKPPTAQLVDAMLLKAVSNVGKDTTKSVQKLIGIDSVLRRLDKIASSTSELAKKSYVEKVVQGVKHAAMLVTAVADEEDDEAFLSQFESLDL